MDSLKQFLTEHKLADADRVRALEEQAAQSNRSLDRLLIDEASIANEDLRRAYIRSFKKKPLYEILIEQGLITFELAQQIADEFGAMPTNLGKILVERKLISEEDNAKAMARELGLEYLDLTDYQVNDALFNSIDLALMRDYSFIPHHRGEKEIELIMADPGNVDAIEALEVKLGLPIVPRVASHRSIQRLIALLVETSLDSKMVFSDTEQLPPLEVIIDKDAEESAPPPGVAVQKELGEEAPVIRLVDSIILKGVRKRASDIHFETYESQLKVKYRIDGVLFEVLSDVEPRLRKAVVSRLKVMAQLDIAEKRVPQDGRFKLKIDERFVDFRVSVLPCIFGETVVLRILDKSALGLDIRKLGLEGNDLTVFQRNVRKPYGMLLVAGPTGSGKTTTLYSAIKFVHTPGQKFVTIEDPVEYQLPDIVQVAVNEKKGMTFSSGLRSILRQDPNKIMVGEIRDPETAHIAINAALTGHLVLSTIHANNVIDAISRLTNMKIDPYEFVSSFNLIMSQRLVRIICPNCKIEDTTITQEAKDLTPDYVEHAQANFLRGKGCRYCHDMGYQGRKGLFEVLEMSPQIKQMVLNKESPLKIKSQALSAGMTTLRQAGWKRVENGETTFEELNRVTFEEGILQ
ncbi:MAG TPA: GspE/PulE family protein [Candidatus Ozemobacteraceae bacterium]|nr:GspE/PulE family protein [Candidatus Ozemobacteraceae bacterium]